MLSGKVKFPDDVKILPNGKLATTGDCETTVKLGLIKKTNFNTWHTLFNITDLGTLLCGFDRHNWRKDTMTTSLLNYTFISHIKNEKEMSGTYCFTYVEFRRSNSIVCKTNEFKITH